MFVIAGTADGSLQLWDLRINLDFKILDDKQKEYSIILSNFTTGGMEPVNHTSPIVALFPINEKNESCENKKIVSVDQTGLMHSWVLFSESKITNLGLESAKLVSISQCQMKTKSKYKFISV